MDNMKYAEDYRYICLDMVVDSGIEMGKCVGVSDYRCNCLDMLVGSGIERGKCVGMSGKCLAFSQNSEFLRSVVLLLLFFYLCKLSYLY